MNVLLRGLLAYWPLVFFLVVSLVYAALGL